MFWFHVYQVGLALVGAFNILMMVINLRSESYWWAAFSATAATMVFVSLAYQWRVIKRQRRWEERERRFNQIAERSTREIERLSRRHWEAGGVSGEAREIMQRMSQREIGIAQRQLDFCFQFECCPDCAHMSLAFFGDGEMMCSEVGCNSRFHRDPKTGTWSRL